MLGKIIGALMVGRGERKELGRDRAFIDMMLQAQGRSWNDLSEDQRWALFGRDSDRLRPLRKKVFQSFHDQANGAISPIEHMRVFADAEATIKEIISNA